MLGFVTFQADGLRNGERGADLGLPPDVRDAGPVARLATGGAEEAIRGLEILGAAWLVEAGAVTAETIRIAVAPLALECRERKRVEGQIEVLLLLAVTEAAGRRRRVGPVLIGAVRQLALGPGTKRQTDRELLFDATTGLGDVGRQEREHAWIGDHARVEPDDLVVEPAALDRARLRAGHRKALVVLDRGQRELSQVAAPLPGRDDRSASAGGITDQHRIDDGLRFVAEHQDVDAGQIASQRARLAEPAREMSQADDEVGATFAQQRDLALRGAERIPHRHLVRSQRLGVSFRHGENAEDPDLHPCHAHQLGCIEEPLAARVHQVGDQNGKLGSAGDLAIATYPQLQVGLTGHQGVKPDAPEAVGDQARAAVDLGLVGWRLASGGLQRRQERITRIDLEQAGHGCFLLSRQRGATGEAPERVRVVLPMQVGRMEQHQLSPRGQVARQRRSWLGWRSRC